MGVSFGSRLKHAWNILTDRTDNRFFNDLGASYTYRPDRPRLSRGNERTIVTSVYNRIALDCAAITIRHVRIDENERYIGDINSGLNNCFKTEANIDQTGRALVQDIVLSMMDEGVVAIVPIDTTINPNISGSYDIITMRTGKILEWFPEHIRVRLYNDKTGREEEIVIPKRIAAIVENPLYAVINEPNSTMQRLIRKLSLLDAVDEQSSSGKLDLIIQLPYVIKSKQRQQQAEERRLQIEQQLAGSKYGIAYTDGTEHITQLNRAVENNLMSQIEYLTSMLYSQLGLTQAIMEGTATEEAMLNYYNRTVEPIISAVVDEMKRKFLTKTARSQFQSILFFRDPFKLAPVAQIAEIADKFTRNEIMTSNEIRQIVGMKPSDDPSADELRNKNLSQSKEETDSASIENENLLEIQNTLDLLDVVDLELDDIEKELEDSDIKHYASPYYDPVKAHEYYEAHKQLKGRNTSTAGLNDEGKEEAANIKERLTNIKSERIAEDSDKAANAIAVEQKRMARKVEQNTKRLERLQERLQNMSGEEKLKNGDALVKEISQIRNGNASLKEYYQYQFTLAKQNIQKQHRETSVLLNEKMKDEYAEELEKLRKNSKYAKSSGGTSSSNSTNNSTGRSSRRNRTRTTVGRNGGEWVMF